MHAHLPLEIWFIIADSFFSKATLRSLCLVSKDLNVVFTPLLYRTISLPCVWSNWGEDRKLKDVSEMDTETHLRFTRHLEIGEGWKSITDVVLNPLLLSLLFAKMTELQSCKVWCHTSYLKNVYLAPVTDMAMFSGTDSQLPRLPKPSAFENLCSLDLRQIKGPFNKHKQDIARILIRWPKLKLLGLELASRPYVALPDDFLVGIVVHFKRLREENGTPDLQLELQELILGRGMAVTTTHPGAPGHLHELTDLSKLRSLTILNEGRSGWDQSRVLLNHRLFLQASNLKSLSVYFFDRNIVALIRALSCYGSIQQIEIRSIRDYKKPKFHWYRPIAELGGGWRKLLLGGRSSDVCPENLGKEVLDALSSQSSDIEEIGIPYIRWDIIKPHLGNFRNLRVLMAGYHKYVPDEWCLKHELAERIIKAHRKAMRDQGLASKLRYIGIGKSVYTLTYPIPLANRKDQKPQRSYRRGSTYRSHKLSEKFEIVELEAEEANSFDFIKNLEKTHYR